MAFSFGHGLLQIADNPDHNNLWREAGRQAQLAVEEVERFYEETKYDPRELHDFITRYDGKGEIPEIVYDVIYRKTTVCSSAMYREVMIKLASLYQADSTPIFLGLPASTTVPEEPQIDCVDHVACVVDQTGCSEATARDALARCDNDIIQAIMSLTV